ERAAAEHALEVINPLGEGAITAADDEVIAITDAVGERDARANVLPVGIGLRFPGVDADRLRLELTVLRERFLWHDDVAGLEVEVTHQPVIIRWDRIVIPAQAEIERQLRSHLDGVHDEQPQLFGGASAIDQRVYTRGDPR